MYCAFGWLGFWGGRGLKSHGGPKKYHLTGHALHSPPELPCPPLPPHPHPLHAPAGYVLASDSPAAIRPRWDKASQKRLAATAGAKNQQAVRGGWGDAEAHAEPLNKYYDHERYEQYR